MVLLISGDLQMLVIIKAGVSLLLTCIRGLLFEDKSPSYNKESFLSSILAQFRMVSQGVTVASIRNQWEELRQVTRSKFVETMIGLPVPLPVFMSLIQDYIRAIDAQTGMC